MGFCNQIIHLPKGIRKESAIAAVGQDSERPVQNDDGVPDHRGPDEHDPKEILRLQRGSSLLGDPGQTEPSQEAHGNGLGLLPGGVLMVLADQGNVAPHGQVRDQGNLQGDEPKIRPVFRQKCIQGRLQRGFAIE